MHPAMSAVRHPPCEQSWHTPWLQACPTPHFKPQTPQLFGSLATAVQIPLPPPRPPGAPAPPPNAGVAAGAGGAAGAAVVVVGLGGDAGVAAAHGAADALDLARREAARKQRETGEEEGGQGRADRRRHGSPSEGTDGGVEGSVRGRSRRTVRLARKARPGSGEESESR